MTLEDTLCLLLAQLGDLEVGDRKTSFLYGIDDLANAEIGIGGN